MILELDGLSHRYGDELAVEDVSFGIESGELLALLGPSGCGKTTIVQAIAGHVRPTAGRVLLRGEDATSIPPEDRRVGLVFQRPTLYPHMTVAENVEYGLTARGFEADRRQKLVAEYLDLVDLTAKRDAAPSTLSGGQKRRVELARALAPQPDVLLLDEPLSALDRTLRQRLREAIGRIQRETGVATLFVTHDQADAMALADRLVVLNEGRVSGIGPPRRLYTSPPNRFVASFLGRSNVLSAEIVDKSPPTIDVADRTAVLDGETLAAPVGSRFTCHVRPEDLSLGSSSDDASWLSIPAEVESVADVGSRYDVTVRTTTGEELVVEQSDPPPSVGQPVFVGVSREAVTVFGPEDRAD